MAGRRGTHCRDRRARASRPVTAAGQVAAAVRSAAMHEPVCETVLAVDGMFCGGCGATIERALRRVPGVQEVSASFLSDSVFVRHDASRVTRQGLTERLAALGYENRLSGSDGASLAANTFQRSHRIRLAVALGFGMWVMLASIARYATELPSESFAWWIALVAGFLSLPVLTVSGGPFFRVGWRGLRAGVPGMESLILVATVAAVSASIAALATDSAEVWFEVPLMLITFQLVARLSDFGARRRAADAVRAVLDLSPERAWLVAADGEVRSVAVGELVAGDVIESRAGERIAADGDVIDGAALIDRALMSGESLPLAVTTADNVVGGSLNVDGRLRIEVTAACGERTLDRLATTVGCALRGKSDLMRLVDRVAGRLVVIVALAAALAFVLALGAGGTVCDALVRALAVLVVSCPCALSLAAPLVVSATIATAARSGIVLRDPAALENAGRIDTVLLDKTGTLTSGRPSVADVRSATGHTTDDVLALAAWLESDSNHPLARAVVRHALERDAPRAEAALARLGAGGGDRELDDCVIERHERAGSGVRILLADGTRLLAGSERWLDGHGVGYPPSLDGAGGATIGGEACNHACSRVLIALDARAIGVIELMDTPRDGVAALLDSLRCQGLRIVLASGDTPGAVDALATPLGLDWHAGLDPEAKRALVESLQQQARPVAFVGDGLNDGPALALADLGIATGEASDLARGAAAMSVLHGGLDRVDTALWLARRAARVLRQNLLWALFYNAAMLPAAVLGYVHPLMGVLAMAASSVSVSLNSLRLVRIRRRTPTAAVPSPGAKGRARPCRSDPARAASPGARPAAG